MQATEQGKVLAGKLKMEFADRSHPNFTSSLTFTILICLYTESIQRRKAAPGIDSMSGLESEEALTSCFLKVRKMHFII